MPKTETKTIVIDMDNYEFLKEQGRTGDSFNDVLTRIVAEYKKLKKQ